MVLKCVLPVGQSTKAYDCPHSAMRPAPRNADNHYLARILSDLVANSLSWPFREPVKPEDVPDYYDVIKNPMGMFGRFSQCSFSIVARRSPDNATQARHESILDYRSIPRRHAAIV